MMGRPRGSRNEKKPKSPARSPVPVQSPVENAPDTPPKSEHNNDDSDTPKSPVTGRNVPDVLYAEDGQVFYPCKHCCRAFANQPDMNRHTAICAGGRSTPVPFRKRGSSVRPIKSEEVNNNNSKRVKQQEPPEEPPHEIAAVVHTMEGTAEETPKVPIKPKKARGRPRGSTRAKLLAKNRKPLPKLINSDANSNCQTNIITIDSVAENINNLPPATKATVLENINRLLKDSSISVLAPKDSGPIIVETAASHSLPALQLTSRNINDTSVEIKTIKKGGVPKEPSEKLPDIAEILEMNFGVSKPVYRPDYYPPSPESIDLPETSRPPARLPPRAPKSVVQESVVGDSEIEELALDAAAFEGTIVLEDLDIHICKQCGSVYHTLEDLVIHDKYEHRNIKKRYPTSELEKFDVVFKSADSKECPICRRVLSSKAAWPRHLQTHSVELNFECSVCRKKFTRNDHRKLHEKRHVFSGADEC